MASGTIDLSDRFASLFGLLDLVHEEGIVVPLVEDKDPCWAVRIRAVEDYPGMAFSKQTSTMEIPKHRIDDLLIWEHELVEITVAWMLHTILKEDSESKWRGWGSIPIELNPKIIVERRDHMISHIMSGLTNISGFNGEELTAEEYSEKLPWKGVKVKKSRWVRLIGVFKRWVSIRRTPPDLEEG